MRLFLAAAIALFCALPASAAGDVVATRSGALRGVVSDGVVSFKGIPFAAPPVGELRWRAPQRPAKWKGVRDASAFGPDCQQTAFPGDAAPLGVTPAEDCLYLNVWAPAERGKGKLPVMFWIYGGGFVNGGASPAVYDGSAFARGGVILVSANYRVGRFGFFAHPALSAENEDDGRLGNYAIMDQIAALEWVQGNIAKFGGDPDNVTIFGESAGGMSVHDLMTSPLADGLFAKAISESGGGRTAGVGGLAPLAAAEAAGVEFAKQHGIEGEGSDALAKLRALPASEIDGGLNMMTMSRQPFPGQIADRVVLPAPSAELYARGKAQPVPLIVGANDADGFFFGGTLDQIYAPFGDLRAEAEKAYDPEGRGDARVIGTHAGADQMFIEPSRYAARLHTKNGHPAYVYRFSYVADSLRASQVGAAHATEIPFVFDTVRARYGDALTEQDARVAAETHAYWVAFAKTGVPAPAGLPAWPAYDPKTDVIVDFRAEGPVVGPDPAKARLDVVEKAAKE